MRTIHNILGIGIVALLVLACQTEPLNEPTPNQVQVTFNAGFAGQEDTKTLVHEDGTSIWWSPKDSISVFHGTASSSKFVATNTEPAAFTTFEGTLNLVTGSIETGSSQEIWAVYPYSPENAFDGGSVTLTVPAEQVAAAGTFAPGMFPAIAKAARYDLAFYNVCGGVVFSVVNEGITSVELKGANGETLAGKVKVAFDSEGYPAVQQIVSGEQSITLSAPEGESFIPGQKYYITTLPGLLENGCSLVFHKPFAENMLEKTESMTINRSLFKMALEADQGMTFVDTLVLQASPREFDLSKAAQDIEVEIAANVRYSVEISQEDREWISVYDSNDPSDTWRFLVTANETPNVRAGKILFRQNDGALTDTVFVHQEEADVIIQFADQKVKDKLVAAFDTDGDGELSVKEARVVSSLEGVFGTLKTYKSFDEFQYFTGITSIPYGMFQGWVLTTITLPETITTIGAYAFNGCASLSVINIPESVTKIGEGAFVGCASLTSLSIPEGVVYLDYDGCSSLTSIKIPEGMDTIGYRAFYGCSSLTTITIPESVKRIDGFAFGDCTSLATVTIPNGVLSIGNDAFFNCTSLTAIAIPESVTSIGPGIFSGCTSLTTVSIPESIASIADCAFSGCNSLTTITIPESISIIGDNAFTNCTSLTTVTIPESVTSIGDDAFWNCSCLTSVSILGRVTSIGFGTFSGCNSLTTITIPESITSIGRYAFDSCSALTTITIPESTAIIGEYAFSNCNNLTSVTIFAISPPTLTSPINTIFPGTYPIYVPAGSVDTYKSDNNWSEYADRIQAIPVSVPEAVDLGLSVKWASFNLGATKPEESGDYFAWGEIETKSEYTCSTYRWGNNAESYDTMKFIKYCPEHGLWNGEGYPDNKLILDIEDDAAHSILGGKWRMPTHDEVKELSMTMRNPDYKWEWLTIGGHTGLQVTYIHNGNSVFFPTYYVRTDELDAGAYWTSSIELMDPRNAYFIEISLAGFHQLSIAGCSGRRHQGKAIRPVSE